MATFNKFNAFAVDVSAGAHTLTTAGSQLKIALTNTAPVATNGQLSDITQISYTNITETMPADVTNVGAESPAGTWDVSGTDITLNATGAVATFRYVVLYNETATNDELIGWWDYGSGITMASGETFTVDFGTSIFTVA